MPCPGLDEEFGSLKHLNSPSEASNLREKVVYSTKQHVGWGWCRFWYTDLRGSGGTVYVVRNRWLNTGGEQRHLAIGSQGWQDS